MLGKMAKWSRPDQTAPNILAAERYTAGWPVLLHVLHCFSNDKQKDTARIEWQLSSWRKKSYPHAARLVLPWHFRGLFIPRRQVLASTPHAASNTIEPSSSAPRCSNLHRYETMETQILQARLLLGVSSQDDETLESISTKLITIVSGTTRHHTYVVCIPLLSIYPGAFRSTQE